LRLFKRLLISTPAEVQLAGKVDSELANAREALQRGDYLVAQAAYSRGKHADAGNLECRLGLAICQSNLGATTESISEMERAREIFGEHDAILGLLTRSLLTSEQWDKAAQSWLAWSNCFVSCASGDFYRVTGELWVAFHRAGQLNATLVDQLVPSLLYQHDDVGGGSAMPALCGLLFHYHEYDREVFRALMLNIREFDKRNGINAAAHKATAVAALTFGLVAEGHRQALLAQYWRLFGLYEHWSFILIGAAWNAIWDDALKSSTANIKIVAQLLNSSLSSIADWEPDFLYRAIFLANVCGSDVDGVLRDEMRKRTQSGRDLGSYKEDFLLLGRHQRRIAPSSASFEGRPLKIAICVSGQLRGYVQAFASWHLMGLAGHEITYFVHTWKGTGGGMPVPPKDERCFSPDFQQAYRTVWNALGQEEMCRRYRNLFALWDDHGEQIDAARLKNFYGTEHVCIEDETSAPFNIYTNAQKMYYKIKCCHDMATASGQEFDLVIRIRPDFELTKEMVIDWPAVYSASSSRRVLFCEHYSVYFFANIGYSMPDQFAIATPEVMADYANAYVLGQEGDKAALLHVPPGYVAHRNVAYATLYGGIKIEPVGIACKLPSTYRPAEELLRQAIIADSAIRCDAYDALLLQALR